MGKKRFGLILGGILDQTISAKYQVESGGNTYDAFDLAKACMDDWEAYLKSKGLL